MATVHIETKRQRQAFEFYYSMGPDRNQTRVSQRFNVSRWSISQWSMWYKWSDKIEKRNKEIATADGVNMEAYSKKVSEVFDIGPVHVETKNGVIPLTDASEVNNQVEKDISDINPEDKLAIKKSYREIVQLALKTYKEKLISGKVKVNIGDIERLMKLDFALLGDNMDSIDINIKTDKATMEFTEKEGILTEKVRFWVMPLWV